jgi:hypothetical protein
MIDYKLPLFLSSDSNGWGILDNMLIMMKKDFLSVCIITKDEEKHLLKTLEYLSKQSY